MKKFSCLIFTLALFLACVAFFLPARADAQVGISLYPVKFNVVIEPGTAYSDTVTVINPNDFSIGVRPEIENISGGDEGSIDLIETEIPHGLMAWISIDRREFTLGPQERKQIPFTVSVPQNGEPGGHYGAILFRALSSPGGAGSGVGISGRVGSVMLVEVPGETKKTGIIEEFSGPSSYVSHGPLNFTAKIRNTGNTHFNPEGGVMLRGPLFPEETINFEPRIVFPDHNRTFSVSWPHRYAVGPMTATLTVKIPGGVEEVKTIKFFVFPWQEAVGILLILLLAWFGIRGFAKNFKLVRVRK